MAAEVPEDSPEVAEGLLGAVPEGAVGWVLTSVTSPVVAVAAGGVDGPVVGLVGDVLGELLVPGVVAAPPEPVAGFAVASEVSRLLVAGFGLTLDPAPVPADVVAPG